MLVKCGNIDISNRVLSCVRKGNFNDGFIIGQCPSFQLELNLNNKDDFFNDKLNELFYYTEPNSIKEYVFVVYEMPERYTKELKLKLYDRSYELDVAYTTQLDYKSNQVTILDQLSEMEQLTGFSFDVENVPANILGRIVDWYDNTITIRSYMKWIAELFASNIFAEGENNFVFKQVSKEATHKTLIASDYLKDEAFTISRVCFDNSVIKAEQGDTSANTLYISCNNLYVEDDNKDEIVQGVYAAIGGLSIYSLDSLTTKNISDVQLGCIVDYNDEFNFMITDISSKLTSASTIVQTLKGKMVSKNEEKQINRIDNATQIRALRVVFDQEKLKWSVTAQEVEGQNEKIAKLELSTDEINQSITKIEETVKNIDLTYYHAEVTCSGTSITRDNSSITMSVQVLNKSEEVATSESAFNWKRVSSNTESDVTWNNAHKGRKSIVITSSDLEASANFYCDISAPEWQGSTSAITVVDETKIPQLGNSFLDVTGVQSIQTLNTDGSYSPSWIQTNPVITPSVTDRVLDVPLSECFVTYKRIVNGTEQALVSGETVTNGILTISKNVMNKALTAITYVAFITYKEVTIKLFTSFSLNVLAQDGDDGKDGVDGKEIKSIQTLFAISTSKTVTPTTGWSAVQPIWTSGKYLWKKQKYTYSDNSTSETNAEVDTSWEAVNEIEVGGRNLLLKSNLQVTSTGYPIKSYTMTEKMVLNETYTCTLWGTLGAGKKSFRLYLDGGSIRIGDLLDKGNDVYQFTFKGKAGTSEVSKLYVYPVDSSVSAESTIIKIKLEKGNKGTDWTPASEDVKQEISDTEVRITESYNSAINQTKTDITGYVNEAIESIGDWQSALHEVENKMTLTKDFTDFVKTTTSTLTDLKNGKVDINEIREWARFNGATLELGASNSVFKAILTNTELGFYQANTKVAWISNNELHVTRIVSELSVQIKSFIWEDEGSYGLSLKKVGE